VEGSDPLPEKRLTDNGCTGGEEWESTGAEIEGLKAGEGVGGGFAGTGIGARDGFNMTELKKELKESLGFWRSLVLTHTIPLL